MHEPRAACTELTKCLCANYYGNRDHTIHPCLAAKKNAELHGLYLSAFV